MANKDERAPFTRRAAVLLAMGMLGAGLLGCSAPDRASQGGAERLYVADAAGGRLLIMDVGGRHAAELALGAPPGRMAPGWGGSVVALPPAGGGAQALLHVSLEGRATGGLPAGRWRVGIAPLAETARDALLAANAGRNAAVVHHEPLGGTALTVGAASPCRLVLVDLAGERPARGWPACRPGERVVGLAMEETAAGPVVYLAIEAGGEPADGGGRVIAIDGSGVVRGSSTLQGAPGQLILGAGNAAGERRLFLVETLARPEDSEPARAYAGRVLRLVPETLDVEEALHLPVTPTSIQSGADGSAYALAGDVLLKLRPEGREAPEGERLPGRGVALAVGAEWLYVAAAYEPRLWILERRTLRVERTVDLPGVAAALLLGR